MKDDGASWWMSGGAAEMLHCWTYTKLMKSSLVWRWKTAQIHLTPGLFRDSIGREG